MAKLKGLATGIGSLPHQNADEALDLIFKYCPEIPFWPQLPKRNIREGMVAQFSEGLPCLKVNEKGLVFDPRDKEKELEGFYAKLIEQDIEYFKISPDFAAGLHKFLQKLKGSGLAGAEFIKCQVTGPFTFAAAVNDEQNIALLHDQTLMQAIIKGLTMKALWQIRLFREFGKKIIIFIDEPYLGCFGSAYTPVNREEVVKVLSEFTEGIKQEDILIGVHCCGNTDWSIFTEVASIDVINFDAFGFLDKFVLYADKLKGFLERGGIICWGIVPTQEFTAQETPALLFDKIKSAIGALEKKGLDKSLLSERLLLSPSCGLGTLDTQKSARIFQLLAQVSALVRKT
ncbi:MAG: hypothetical protein WC321_00800 [Candidatus Omnitrophota bacterium]|jgi:methionine synthase II (cobalamin-independent)